MGVSKATSEFRADPFLFSTLTFQSAIPARPIFFPRTDDSHCDRIHSSLTAVRCFDNGYVGKQPVAWKEYRLKDFQESMDRCTDRRDVTEIYY